jgi:flagellin
MSRIGYTLSGVERQLLASLSRSNAQIAISTLRMATGHKINSAGDNPSAFVQLSGLQSQLSGVSAALGNVTAAGSLVAQVQSAVSGFQSQLGAIRTELLKDANHTLTPEQRAASQNAIDAAIAQINTLAGTQIYGKTPLSGAGNYIFSGLDSAQVAALEVSSLGRQGQTISGTVTSTATRAALTYTGDASDQVTDDAVFTLAGSRGGVVLSVTAGSTLQSVADTVNNDSYLTGVTASVDTASHTLILASVDCGSQAKTQVTVSSGTFSTTGDTAGTNASAVINGQTVAADSTHVSGNRFSLNDNGLTFDIEFQPGFTGGFNTITVSGDALTFALSPDVSQRSTLAIPGMYAAELGGSSGTLDQLATGGALSGLGDNTAQAIRVVDEALGDVNRVSGGVGGFYKSAIGSASTLMTAMQTNLQKSIDAIDKTDDAAEEANIAHYQILADNAVASLAILSHQQQTIVDMIRSIAGLSNYGSY